MILVLDLVTEAAINKEWSWTRNGHGQGLRNMTSYDSAVRSLGLIKLKQRRDFLTKKVALQLVTHPKFAHLFKKRQCLNTRSKFTFVEPYSKT